LTCQQFDISFALKKGEKDLTKKNNGGGGSKPKALAKRERTANVKTEGAKASRTTFPLEEIIRGEKEH